MVMQVLRNDPVENLRVTARVGPANVKLRPGIVVADLTQAPQLVTATGGDPGRPPLLDGRVMVPVANEGTLFAGELRVGTGDGYHEVLCFIPGRQKPIAFGFCTSQSSRRADLVRRMMEYVSGVAQVPQELFLLGALGEDRRRSPGVLVGWLTDRLPDLVETLGEIAARPAMADRRHEVKRSWAARPSVTSTRRLLRRRPDLLQERDDGILRLGERRYTPLFVVDRSVQRSYNLPEHRQALAFMAAIGREVAALHGADLLGAYDSTISRWNAAGNAAGATLIRRGANADPSLLKAAPTPLQQRDPRYRRVYELLTEFRRLRSFEPADDELRTLVESGHKLYQAFVAYVIADALALKPVGQLLTDRHRRASFVSNEARLYYDVKPPETELPSWRDRSAKPDGYRPDVTVVHDRLGVLLVDAKFKDYDGGSDLQGDLEEMQAYHDSFGLTRSVLATPFGRGLDVAGSERLIRVLPISPPPPAQDDLLRSYLRDRLTMMFRPRAALNQRLDSTGDGISLFD